MTDECQQRAEILANEAWLNAIAPSDAMPDIDLIKKRVHIAVDEMWLDKKLVDTGTQDLTDRIKQRLRETASDSDDAKDNKKAQPTRRLWRPAPWLAGLGAAALVALAFIPMNRELEEMVSADAFEQFQIDDFDHAMQSLDTDLQDLEFVMDDWGQLSDSNWLVEDFS